MTDHGATIRCDCGERLTTDGSTTTVTCGCGAVYAVTVTQLEPSREQSRPSPGG